MDVLAKPALAQLREEAVEPAALLHGSGQTCEVGRAGTAGRATAHGRGKLREVIHRSSLFRLHARSAEAPMVGPRPASRPVVASCRAPSERVDRARTPVWGVTGLAGPAAGPV